MAGKKDERGSLETVYYVLTTIMMIMTTMNRM